MSVREEEYIAIVGEIFDGYTEFDFEGRSVYLKHFSIKDQRYIHKYYDKYKKIAVDKGIPTQGEMLIRLAEDGLWSSVDDKKIAELESEIESLNQTRKNIYLPSQKKAYQDNANERRSDLYRLKKQRDEVVGKTAEDYASNRSNEEFIRYIIYKDKNLEDNLFTDDEFAELDNEELEILLREYRSCGERLGESPIQHAVLRDFFNMYISQTDNISAFYGKPIVNLSVYQLKLALYSKVFHGIFQNNEGIPESIRHDPSALLGFAENKRNAGSSSGKSRVRDSDSGATAVFGATQEDLDFVDPDAKKIVLSDELKKQGGVLTMEQIMNMTNS